MGSSDAAMKLAPQDNVAVARPSRISRLPRRRLEMRVPRWRERGVQKKAQMRLAAYRIEFGAIEITRLQDLLAVGFQRAADRLRAEYGRDPRDRVAVRVRADAQFAAEDADHMGQRDEQAGFLPRLAHGRVRRRLVRLDHAARCRPVVAFDMTDEQHAPALIEYQHTGGRDFEHRRADLFA